MNKIIKVVAADDQPLSLAGIRWMLSRCRTIQLCGSAGDGYQLLKLIEKLRPDIALVDINMPGMNGIQLTQKILHRFPATKVIAFSMYDEQFLLQEMLEAGARGYLLKDAMQEELHEAIIEVNKGREYFCRVMNEQMNDWKEHKEDFALAEADGLSFRDITIIRYICEQYSNKQIAEKIFRKIKTVEKFRRAIMQKIGVSNSIGIVLYALSHNIFSIDRITARPKASDQVKPKKNEAGEEENKNEKAGDAAT